MTATSGLRACLIAAVMLVSWHSSLAGPINPNPQTNQPNPRAETSDPEDLTPLQQVDVTSPPPNSPRTPGYFYPYDSSFSLSYGPVFLSPATGLVVVYGQFTGTYVWASTTSFHVETGLDATSGGQGQLWGAFRDNFISTGKWRPFWSLGFGFKIYPERGLATFLSLSNYFLRAALGVEYSLWEALSLRSEIFLSPDMEGRGFFGGTLGFAYGF